MYIRLFLNVEFISIIFFSYELVWPTRSACLLLKSRGPGVMSPKNLEVLLIDNDVHFLKNWSQRLRQYGHESLCADSWERTFHIIERTSPKLILIGSPYLWQLQDPWLEKVLSHGHWNKAEIVCAGGNHPEKKATLLPFPLDFSMVFESCDIKKKIKRKKSA